MRLLRQVAENEDRDDLSLYERALAVHRAHQLSAMTAKDFAMQNGLDPTVVSSYRALVNSKGPTKAALEQGLLRDVGAARLFTRLPVDLQEGLIKDATEKESFLTRPMLTRVLEGVENAKKNGGGPAKRPPAPSPTPSPAPASPVPSDGPVLSVDELLLLEELTRPDDNTPDTDPLRTSAHAALHKAVLLSSAYIAISESTAGERRSPRPEMRA